MSKDNLKGGAQAPLLGSKIQVKIEKMAIGGAGIARHEGMVIFVPLAAPEDELLVEITSAKKNFAEARILDIIHAGPERRAAPCLYFQRGCGGCNWQHLTEKEQHKQKHLLVFEALKKFLPDIDFDYLPLVPSSRSFRYRNRIQPKAKNKDFGFFERSTHNILNIEDCLITEESLSSRFSEVRDWAHKINPYELKKIEMYLTDGEVVRYGLIDEEDDGVGFSQVNRFQNQDLTDATLNWADSTHYDKIFDLYAGSGNFTFPLLNKYSASEVIAVEMNPKLVQKGREALKEKRLTYFLSDVESYIRRAPIGKNDLVVLDPPRAGASEDIMRTLIASRPKKIIYISCHPVSLARDLKWALDWAHKLKISVNIEKVQTFEMFPQTDHVETIAVLRVDS